MAWWHCGGVSAGWAPTGWGGGSCSQFCVIQVFCKRKQTLTNSALCAQPPHLSFPFFWIGAISFWHHLISD